MIHSELLKRLLPPVAYDANGRQLAAELDAEGNALDAAQSIADQILAESDPRTTDVLLADWERVAGLSAYFYVDGTPLTLGQRRAALVAQLNQKGGQNAAFFIALAATLGFTVTVTEYTEWSVRDDVESAFNHTDWRFVWRVNAALFLAGEWTVGSDVEAAFSLNWFRVLLESALVRHKPAHTILLFKYS